MITANKLALGLLILPSLLAGLLWLASGRETLTKHTRNVEVEVRDEVFGDTITRTQSIPGPVFGYYIGADLVVLVTLASFLAAGACYGCNRWRLAHTQKERDAHAL